jgi:hypothetical protein
MALDFPNAPALGATYSSGGTSWKWDGAKWAQSALVSNPLIVAPPVAASWTQRNIASPAGVADVTNGVQIFETPASATPANSLRQLTLAAPSTPYTVDMLFGYNGGAAAVANASVSFGALWTDGTKIQTALYSYISTTTAAVSEFFTANFSTFSTFAASVGSAIYQPANLGAVWFRLADNGTTVSFSFSLDGVTFVLLYSVAKVSGYLGASGYTNIGFHGSFLTQGSTTWQSAVTLKSWWVH